MAPPLSALADPPPLQRHRQARYAIPMKLLKRYSVEIAVTLFFACLFGGAFWLTTGGVA
jgi:hypothetical protein